MEAMPPFQRRGVILYVIQLVLICKHYYDLEEGTDGSDSAFITENVSFSRRSLTLLC
jgi:hypothetical protein